MLPVKERLTRAGLFQRAYSAKKVVSTEFFSLYVLPKTGKADTSLRKTSLATRPASQEIARIHSSTMPLVGFVVAKKVCKSSCLRNKVKRRIREAYRLLRLSDQAESQQLSQWYAMVFVIQPKALEADFKSLQNSVSTAIAKADTRFGRQQAKDLHTKQSTNSKDSEAVSETKPELPPSNRRVLHKPRGAEGQSP